MTGWRVANGQLQGVVTSKGELQADEYVIAGGAWSPQVARGLGVKLPMQAGKGYSLTLRQPRKLPDICAIFVEARVDTDRAEDANNMVQVAMGLMALGRMAAANEPEMQPLFKLMDGCKIGADGATLNASFKIDSNELANIVATLEELDHEHDADNDDNGDNGNNDKDEHEHRVRIEKKIERKAD